MNLSNSDIGAVAGFIVGGGLAGITGLMAVIDPAHATFYAAAMGAVISLAGLVRVITNPTPTNAVTVFDRTTGSTVEMKTVASPSATPAPPPTYTTK